MVDSSKVSSADKANTLTYRHRFLDRLVPSDLDEADCDGEYLLSLEDLGAFRSGLCRELGFVAFEVTEVDIEEHIAKLATEILGQARSGWR